MTASRHVGVFLRGMAMGVAEVVPGISGGTMAFITGIYDELLRSLAAFSATSFAVLRQGGWGAFVRHHNLPFLIVLGVGMACSFLALANVLLALLESLPEHVSAFFFGMIAGSVVHIGAQTNRRWLATAGAVGLALGLATSLLADGGATQTNAGVALVFVAGALAATAWILPGVSGAFILLLLGLYKPLLQALTDLDVAVVVPFAAGVVLGLLAFAKLLRWLLAKARVPVLALLTGFMAGSLVELWPWRAVPAVEPALIGVLAAMAAGAAAVAALSLASRRVR